MYLKWMFMFLLLTASAYTFAAKTSVPFMHKPVPSDGLVIRYDMNGQYLQKVACVFDHFYQGEFTYIENGVEKNALPFGNGDDGQEIFLTSQGKTWDKTQGRDNLEQFHVDARGSFFVKDNLHNPNRAYASCFYLPENDK